MDERRAAQERAAYYRELARRATTDDIRHALCELAAEFEKLTPEPSEPEEEDR